MSDYGVRRKWFGLRPRSQEFAEGVDHVTLDTPPEEPTHGPWADHGPRCRCNVCR